MIKNRDHQIRKIAKIITTQIVQFNNIYRGGPSLYFYHRIRDLRQQHPCIVSFLSCNTCIECLYSTLVSWDMNSRGAKMKDYSDFCMNLKQNLKFFQDIENVIGTFSLKNRTNVISTLSAVYDTLDLMQTGGKLVSNSKCLHFLFPSICMPMDRTNTLQKIYSNTAESKNKFIELLELSFDVIAEINNPKKYFDNKWNTCEMKLVDNAIIMM